MRDAKDQRTLRLRIVQYARQHANKPGVRLFCCSVHTVRKWVGRFDETLASLASQTRGPHHRPKTLPIAAERKIIKLKKRLPRWSARRLKRDFELPRSDKAIRRACRDHGLNRKYRRRKHQTKRCLREIKRAWRVFQQIGADTKDLYQSQQLSALGIRSPAD